MPYNVLADIPGREHAGMTTLIVAESLALVRDGLAGLLAAWPHGPLHTAASLEEATALLSASRPAVLLLDLNLLGETGLASLPPLRARFPALRVLAMAPREGQDDILACLAAGMHGYVSKAASAAELLRAVDAVHGGSVHVPVPSPGPAPGPALGLGMVVRAAGPRPAAAPTLTGRQQDVLRLLAEGRSTKDIARTLDLAVSTIKVHLAALYRTVGARNRVEALCRAGRVTMPVSS